MSDNAPEHRVKVFISYSRADKAFASDLVLGLAACGFAPYIDREDIAAGEDWEARLSGLISEADSIVYVISPESVVSTHCGWELAESLRLSKRVLPVVWRQVEDKATPAELRRLNYIFFSGEGRTFAAGLSELATALRTDIDWIREHTRLGELAQRWTSRRRSPALLLRGEELDAALAWMRAKPMSAPAVTDAHADFIKASSDARIEAERRAARARAGLLTAASLAAVVFAGLAGLAAWQWRTAAAAEGEARIRRDEAVAAKEALEDANLRLTARIGLRTAPAEDGYFVIGDGWYPVAANYSGAVARVERSGGAQASTLASGFVIDGGLVHPRYAGQALLLTPAGQAPQAQYDLIRPGGEHATADTLPADAPLTPQLTLTSERPEEGALRLTLAFPAVSDRTIEAAEQVWKTPDYLGGVYPFELWTLSEPLPRGARAIVEDDVDCQPFETLASRRPIGSFGVSAPGASDPRELVLSISDLLDGSDPYEMLYTHATNTASYGAPVFDLTTGDVLAVHLTSRPDPDRPGRRLGGGASFRFILDMARQQIKDARLGPMCET